MTDEMKRLGVIIARSGYTIDPNVPLRKTKHVDGCDLQCGFSCPQVDALCWEIDGKIYIHPVRYDQYFAPLERALAEAKR